MIRPKSHGVKDFRSPLFVVFLQFESKLIDFIQLQFYEIKF